MERRAQALQVISAIEMDAEDREDYAIAVEALRRVLNRHLSAVWEFKDRANPKIEWDGVVFLRSWREQANAEIERS